MKRTSPTSIKTISLTFLLSFFLSLFSFGQVDIVVNSFEETAADTWTIQTFSTPACTNGSDRWDYSTSLNAISPNDGLQFWGIQDLNGNCGGSSYESLTFASTNVSSYTGVTISFDYYTIGYEAADNLGYEVWEDGVQVVDDVSLSDNSGGWLTVTYNVTASVTNVYLVLKAKQNGGSDYGAFDNVKLRGVSGSPTPSLAVSPSSLTGYTYIEGSGPSTSQSFDLSGSDLDGSQVTVTAPTNYEVSTDNTSFSTSVNLAYTAPTLSGTTIYVRLKAGLVAGTYNGENVTCSDNGTASDVTVTNDGEVTAACSEPSQATTLVFSNISSTSIDVAFTASGADNYLVVQSTSSTLSSDPVDATTYAVSDALGDGTVVYNGSGTSFTDNGLTASTTYYYFVFAYNSVACSGGPNYATPALSDNETTSAGSSYCAEVDFTGAGDGGSYTTNTWTDAGIDWQATDSRGDQDLNGLEAIMLRSGSLTNTTSVAGGMGVISFDYAQKYSGTSTLKVFVNGVQYGGDIAVNSLSSTNFSFAVNVTGNIDLELRNSGNRTLINNLKWECGTPMPELSLEMPTSTSIACGDTYDYGTQTTGTNTNQTLTITNSGTLDLDISSFPLTGTNASEFSISPASTSTTIAAGGTYDIVVTFSPTTAGAKTAEITINSNDDDEGTCVINLTGNGIDPCVTPTAQPTALDLTTNTTTTSIDGTFTAASPVPDSYLVVYSTSSSLSATPTDGVTYAAGDALGGGTVLDNISGTSFTASSLTEGTEYYFFIFSNNHLSCAGGPLYYATTPLNGHEITTPDNASWDSPDCISNSSIELNWTAASGNLTGYLLVVREGAIPHSINSLDPNTQAFDTDYASAPQFGSTTEYSRVVYKGTGTSVTITNLPSSDCVFKIYTYTIGSSDYKYASGTQTTQTISLDDVISPGVICGDSQASLSWSNPDLTCVDEILVVVNETSGIDFSPSGDGTAYTANTVYAAVDQVIYKGTGTSEMVTGLTNGTTYYYEIFTRKGTEWSAGVEISCTPNEVTVLYPGDLAIVAINTQYTGGVSDDEVCFFAFKDINSGTAIDFTDNGYDRVTAGEWGDSEGTIRLQRTGSTIEKGTVICVQGKGYQSSDFTINVCGSNDDANWTISSLNGTGPYDLNENDQIWIMQDGNWNNPAGSHDATYDGNVLYGWTATGWEAAAGYDDTKGSTLFDGAECFNTNVSATTNEDKVKFYADTAQTLSQSHWIGEINSEWNWTGYTDNGDYGSGGLDYANSCVKFKIDNSLGNGEGMWQGGEDNNWFNCANWLNMSVPDETVDVTILSSALNEANIDDTQDDADLYGYVAKCKNLTVQEGGDSVYVKIDDANDKLEISKMLTVQSRAKVYNDNGGTIIVDGNITLEENSLLDIHANPTTGSTINLKGHWIDNNTVDNDTLGLFETGGQVVFLGSSQQTISDATGNETFYDVKLNNSGGLDLNGNNMSVSGTLDLTLGDVTTGSDSVIVLNANTTAIANASANSYIDGYLKRSVNTTGAYDFPVGTATQYELANITLNSSTGISDFTASFSVHPGSHALVDGLGIPLALTVNGSELTEMLDYGFWTIEPDNSTYTVDYDVFLTSQGHTNGGADADQHTIVKRDNAMSDWAAYESNHNNATQSGTGASPITAQLSGLTAFSDYAIARNQQFPLPVHLLYFRANKTEDGVFLEWATASEINNDAFILERSGQIQDFEVIDEQQGMGHSNYTTVYSYLDRNPIEGLSYYKLNQIDFDGTSTDLATVAINHDKSLDYSIYEQILQIELDNDQSYSVEVYNTLGQKVAVISETTAHRIYVDLSFLHKESVYLIRIYNATEEEVIKYKR